MANETFTATQVTDPNTNVRPGETVTTTVTIENNSTNTNAEGVHFSEPLVGMTATGNVNVSPIAFNDAYNLIGNTTFTVNAANGLLANDTEPLGTNGILLDTTTQLVTTGAITTTDGNTVTVNADGSFTFSPNAGYTGTDDFTYQLRDAGIDGTFGNADDLFSTATVSFNVEDLVWFIDDTLGGTGGSGTESDPFRRLEDFNNVNDNVGLHPGDGDFIYLREGNDGVYSEAGGINLRNGQTLVGQGEDLVVNHSVGGNITVATGAEGDTPVIVVTGADAGILLAQNNTIRGLDVGMNNAGAIGIADGGGTVGTLNISNVAVGVNQSTGQAIDIDQGGNLTVTLQSVTATGGPRGIDLGTVAGGGLSGTFTVSGATTINDATVDGIAIANSSLNATFTGAVAITNDVGAATIADGVDLGTGAGGANTGTYSFNGGLNITVNGTNAFGFRAQNSGTVNIVDVGTTQITSVNGTALAINPTVLNATLDSITSSGGATGVSLSGMSGSLTVGSVSINGQTGDGIDIDGSSGTIAINGGTIGNTNSPDGIGVDINAASGNITIAAAITSQSAGPASRTVEVTNSGGTAVGGNQITFSGAIDENGLGINLDNNDANNDATITFSGGLDIDTTTSTGFSATNGGTVVVTGTNTIDSTQATALQVHDTTIGVADLTFQRISAGSGVAITDVGISLSNTGSLGGLHVTGTGAANSGGIIQNMNGANGSTTSGIGIYLNNTSDVQLNDMFLHDFQNYAIFGSNVTGFLLDDSTINGTNGNNNAGGVEEGSIRFNNLFTSATYPTASITDSAISGGFTENIRVMNDSGTLNRLTVTGNEFGLISATGGNDNFHMEATNNAIANVTVSNNHFLGTRADFIETIANLNSTMDVVVRSNDFDNGQTTISGGGTGVSVRGDSLGTAATVTFDISHNLLNDGGTNAFNTVGIFVAKGNGSGTMTGTIASNTIGPADTDISPDPGLQPANADGIFVRSTGAGTTTVLIQNNTISGVGNAGIHLQNNDGSSTMNASVFGNSVTLPNTLNFAGLFADNGGAGGDTSIMNLVVGNANVAAQQNTFDGNVFDVSLSNAAATTFNLSRNGSDAAGANNNAQATDVIQDDNVGNPTVDTTGGLGLITFVNTLPPLPPPVAPLMAASGGVEAAGAGYSTSTVKWLWQEQTAPATDAPSTDASGTGSSGSDSTAPQTTTPENTGSGGDSAGDAAGDAPAGSSAPTTSGGATSPAGDDGILTQAELDAIVNAAITRWADAGLSAEQVAVLESLTFSVSDMSGLYLGSFAPGHITLDSDGAGHGWFVDASPLDDSEFGQAFGATRLWTSPTQAPAGHYDVLTTVMHEMGHALGVEDSYAEGARNDLMYGWLFTGERRLPGNGDADGAVVGSITTEEFLGAPVEVAIGTLPFGQQVQIQFTATIDPVDPGFANIPAISNQGTVSATNPVGFPDQNTNTVTTTLDSLTLGGQIWIDDGAGGGIAGNGLIDGTETGVSGITLTLFIDDGDIANVWDGNDTLLTGGTTAAGGVYEFSGLAEGDYIVRVDIGNFVGVGALAGFPISSVTTPEPIDPDFGPDGVAGGLDDDFPNDDNGARVPGDAAYSAAITLSYDDEPTADAELDLNVNNTLDMGFFSNPPPVIADLDGDSASFTEDGPAVLLDDDDAPPPETAATVTDANNPHFNGGNLTVTVGGALPEDELSIVSGGNLITVAGNVVSHNGLPIGTFVGGTAGTALVVTFNSDDATHAAVSDLLQQIAYDNTNAGDPAATRTVGFTVTDGLGSTSTVSNVTVNVTQVNDAPILADATVVLGAINEDAGAPVGAVGTLVSTLVDFPPPPGNDNVTDPDGNGGLIGIALTGTSGSGTWFYSLNGGALWTPVGIVADGSALLLAVDLTTRLYFQPNADFNGTVTPAITFRAWDQSTGANGDTGVDTTINGGTTAFSTATDTADITVNAVADIVNDLASVTEDSVDNVIDVLATDSFEDANATITSVGPASHGTVTIDDLGNLDPSDDVVLYSPDLDYHGPDAFTYTVTSGGVTVTETANVAVQVTAVADIVDDSVSVNEDSGTNILDVLGNDSFENPDRAIVAVSAAGNGIAAIDDNNTPGILTDDFVTYTADPDYFGPDSFSYTVISGGAPETATVNVTVTEVNDEPIADDEHVTPAVDEDTVTRIITFAELLTGDVAGPANEGAQTLSIISVDNAIGGTVEITGGQIEFHIDPNFNGQASFDYTVQDNGTTNGVDAFLTDVGHVTFDVNPINDEPTFDEGIDPVVVNEDAGAQTFLAWATNILAGPLNESGQALNFVLNITGITGNLGFTTPPAIDPVTGNLTFTAAPNTNGTATIEVQLFDNGPGAPPPNDNASVIEIFQIQVTAVNDAPAFLGLDDTPGFTEDGLPVLLDDDATVSDLELDALNGGLGNYAGAVLTLQRQGGPNSDDVFDDDTVGAVDLIGGDVMVGVTDIGDFTQVGGVLTITFDPDATSDRVDQVLQQLTYENTSDDPPEDVVIAYTFNDGNTGTQGTGGNGIDLGSITVDITPVNDAPDANAVNGGDINYQENQAATPFDPGITVTDPDDTELEGARVTLTGFVAGQDVLSVDLGATGITIVTNAGGVLELGGAADLADYEQVLRTVSYFNSSDDPSTAARTAEFEFDDGGGFVNVGDIGVILTEVNDSPELNTVPPSTAYRRGDPAVLLAAAAGVLDLDTPTFDQATVTITDVEVGDLLAADTTGTAISAAYNAGTGELTLTGPDTLANYQQVLRSITFETTGPNPTRSLTWQLDDGEAANNLSTVVNTTITMATALFDFDGDGRRDVFWRDDAGVLVLWEMDGPTVTDNTVVNGAMPDYWHVLDIADFSGDGRSDVLWQDDAGVTVLWEMDGPTIASSTVIGGTPLPAYWHYEGTGDLNGDGNSDILWRDDAGVIVLWEMDGPDVIANTAVGTLGLDWHVEEINDFNGDGNSDILWRNDDGQVRLWEMDGATVIGDTNLGTFAAYWEIADSGDYNGDGNADLLWQDTAGQVVMWEMDGPTVLANTHVATVPTTMEVVISGDGDGDGDADLLWRDGTTVSVWEMDGPTIVNQIDIATIPTYWHIQS